MPPHFQTLNDLKHPRASNWFKPSEISIRRLHPEVVSWLVDQGSLTKRLIAYSQNRFSVRVLSQSWQRPEINEARLLSIPPRQRILLREVQLLCDGRVVVYARSVIPLKTLRGKHNRLSYLGDRPLGAYLFANPGLVRTHQHLAIITKNDPLFKTALADTQQQCEKIWGRRSMFIMDRKPLLVSEFFLPVLFK